MISFTCNICGEENSVERIDPEASSCAACGSNTRLRAIIYLLCRELFGFPVPLSEVALLRTIKGFGLSDHHNYAGRLAQKFDYVNTFFDGEPRFDITETHPDQYGTYDFIISADVFEHVPPPVERTLEEACRLLKPRGMLCASVPISLNPETNEHYPELHQFGALQAGGRVVLVNRTREGQVQVFEDPVFHGGHGSTLEMRVFSQEDLRRRLIEAGFRDLHFQTEDIPEFGIFLAGTQSSIPFVAHKEEFILDPQAARELAQAYQARAIEHKNTLERLERRGKQVDEIESELVKVGRWALQLEAELKEREIQLEAARAQKRTFPRWGKIPDASPERDERVFVLAMSHFGLPKLRLLQGWHTPELSGWRWTEQKFSVSDPVSSSKVPARVRMNVFIPDVLMRRWGSITLFCRANGVELEPQVFQAAGNQTWLRDLPPSTEAMLHLSFRLDHAFMPGELDDRELGIVVASLDFE